MNNADCTRLAALVAAALFAWGAAGASAQPEYYGYHPHHHGCFVTTSPQHHTKGIRHWVNPCPYTQRRHMNPYHPPHHRPFRPHPSPH